MQRALARRGLSTLGGEATGKHVPYGAVGSGYYSDHTKGCYDVVKRAGVVAMRALDGVLEQRRARGAVAAREPFTLADYGTADAGTSMPLIKRLVATVRAAEPEAPIVVLYEDQSSNDWNSVFSRVHNRIPHAEPSFIPADNVFVLVSGASFYEQCAPAATVDFGFSATAMHWLRAAPASIPDALLATLTTDAGVLAAFEAQAAHDWVAILKQRSAELKPGGALAIANFAVDEQQRFLGKSEHVKESMFDTHARLWRELADEGRITAHEFEATNFPVFYRSLAQCRAPFDDLHGKASELQELEWVTGETDLVRCPYHVRWLAERGDAMAHARRFVPTTRTWSNSTFRLGLDAARSEDERDAIVNELFERYTQAVAHAPDDHAMDYVHSYIHLSKPAV
ncbi:S-adenosyl-L-methionine-dependent methyltransferase [Pavlovales sp. CCMP2436]|nr:S-adenosyl-L-methionine-dependent methyltransferase [Pavlovales sp. CCMP2436]